MAMRVTKRNKAVVSGRLHPHYADVVHTVCGHAGAGMTIEIGGVHPCAPEDLAAVQLGQATAPVRPPVPVPGKGAQP